MLPRIWCQILSNKTQWVSLHPLLWWACPVLPECEMLLSWFSSFWSEYIYDKEQCIFQCKEYIVGVLKGGDINSGVGYIYWEHFPRVEFWIWNCCFRQLERSISTKSPCFLYQCNLCFLRGPLELLLLLIWCSIPSRGTNDKVHIWTDHHHVLFCVTSGHFRKHWNWYVFWNQSLA